jgi:flagellar basal-body rod protein FlgF
MDRLVFTANTAMTEHRLDRQAMTHELANVSTVGFKKAFQIANRPVRTEGDGFDTRFLPRAFTTMKVDLSPGPRMVTGRSLDVAMNGSTVLGVRAENGDLAWTRRGDLQVDAEGFLRTGEGDLVLDQTGAEVQLPVGSVVYEVNEDGSIGVFDPSTPEAGTQNLAVLLIKDASTIDMARREDGLFRPLGQTEDGQDFEAGPEIASISSGALEGSNVSTVYTLVRFIDHMRSFEMQTKVIKEMKDNDASGASMMRVS